MLVIPYEPFSLCLFGTYSKANYTNMPACWQTGQPHLTLTFHHVLRFSSIPLYLLCMRVLLLHHIHFIGRRRPGSKLKFELWALGGHSEPCTQLGVTALTIGKQWDSQRLSCVGTLRPSFNNLCAGLWFPPVGSGCWDDEHVWSSHCNATELSVFPAHTQFITDHITELTMLHQCFSIEVHNQHEI